MGLGAGGSIKQKIYRDPYGVEAWEPQPQARSASTSSTAFSSSTSLDVDRLQHPSTRSHTANPACRGSISMMKVWTQWLLPRHSPRSKLSLNVTLSLGTLQQRGFLRSA